MVTEESTLNPGLVRYRLATALIWVGVLTWVPFIILLSMGLKPSIFWFLPFHLIGVIGGSRLKATARRELGEQPPKKTLLQTIGHILVITGIMVWVVYFSLKLIFHIPVEVGQFLPYHLTAMLSGIAILLVNFLVSRQRS